MLLPRSWITRVSLLVNGALVLYLCLSSFSSHPAPQEEFPHHRTLESYVENSQSDSNVKNFDNSQSDPNVKSFDSSLNVEDSNIRNLKSSAPDLEDILPISEADSNVISSVNSNTNSVNSVNINTNSVNSNSRLTGSTSDQNAEVPSTRIDKLYDTQAFNSKSIIVEDLKKEVVPQSEVSGESSAGLSIKENDNVFVEPPRSVLERGDYTT